MPTPSKGAAVVVLAVAVVSIAPPARPEGGFDLQDGVDHLDRVDDARIIGGPQPEPYQRQGVDADDVDGGLAGLPGGTVLDGHFTLVGRRRRRVFGFDDPQIITVDADTPRQFRIRDIEPTFNASVPGVGRLSKMSRGHRRAAGLRQISGRQQGGDFRRERERGITAVFLPAVLRRGRAVLNEPGRRGAHRRPQSARVIVKRFPFVPDQARQQDGQGDFIHLDPLPVEVAVDPHILRPTSVGLLRRLQVVEHAAHQLKSFPGGEQPPRGFHEVARPDQVVAADVVVSPIETPRNRQTGDDSSRKILGLVGVDHRRAQPIEVASALFRHGEIGQCSLPVEPLADIFRAEILGVFDQTDPARWPASIGFRPKPSASTNRPSPLPRSSSPVRQTLPPSALSKHDFSVFSRSSSVHPSEIPTKPTDMAFHGVELASASA